MILARYLDRAPDQFEFCCNQFGKPELAPSGDTGGLRFNLSHSQGLALYALVRDHEIGVDLECVRADFEWEDIASRSFSPAEVEALQMVPAALRAEAFFHCWTHQEASQWSLRELDPAPGYKAAIAVRSPILHF